MQKSPFKFLDAYTREDKEIFFGREQEINELYRRVFESKILLVYGISGTGKSSLIHCGLANKIQESDWLPVNVRRGSDIIVSMGFAIQNACLSPLKEIPTTPVQFKKAVRSLYLDHYKPVFFIFDQFEELFIFGSKEEKKALVQVIKSLTDSELQCRFIFVMREEYLAGITELEKTIPNFLANRLRIENMSFSNARDAVTGPCKVAGIELEEGFADGLLEKLSPEGTEVELTYLQVFLDKIYRLASRDLTSLPSLPSLPSPPLLTFSNHLLDEAGNVSDLLGSFLDEQIAQLSDPDSALAVLKSFVSVKGTKRQMSQEEVQDYALTLGKPIDPEPLRQLIQTFIQLRILRDKDQNGRYELRHDALAEKIYEKITLVEKELLEIRQLIENAFNSWQKRGVLISKEDLQYVAPYESRLYLPATYESLIHKSKNALYKARRRRRNILAAAIISIFIAFSVVTFWALKQKEIAFQKERAAKDNELNALLANKKAAESEKKSIVARDKAVESESKAMHAKEIAEKELFEHVKNSLVISTENLKVLYVGVQNPINISASGVPSEKLIIKMSNGNIRGENGKYSVIPTSVGPASISVFKKVKDRSLEFIGLNKFSAKGVPDPVLLFGGQKSGVLSKEKALMTNCLTYESLTEFPLKYEIVEFTVSANSGGFTYDKYCKQNLISNEEKTLIENIHDGEKLRFEDIRVICPDGTQRILPSLVITISDERGLGLRDSLYLRLINSAAELIDSKDKEFRLQHLKEVEQQFDALSMYSDSCQFIVDHISVLVDIYNLQSDQAIKTKIYYLENKLITKRNIEEKALTLFKKMISSSVKININVFDLNLPRTYFELVKDYHNRNGSDSKLVVGLKQNLLDWTFLFIKHGDFDDALDCAKLAIIADSTDVISLERLTLAYLYKNQIAEANKLYEKNKDIVISDYDQTFSEYLLNDIIVIEQYVILANAEIDKRINILMASNIKFYRESILKSKVTRDYVSEKFSDISFYLIKSRKYKLALDAINFALEADSTNQYLYTNLPLALILNNRFDEASKTYMRYRDVIFKDQNKTYRQIFLEDIADLESKGITHPDFAKVKELLKK